MEENYAEGNLGVRFTNAKPLTLPTVSAYLSSRGGAHDSETTRSFMQNCLEQVDVLEERCASEDVAQALGRCTLRLRQDGGGFTNAHLMNLQFDAEGNPILGEIGGGAPAEAARQERLKPFEVTALATLVPRSADEAVMLVPSLARFEEADIDENVITRLLQ